MRIYFHIGNFKTGTTAIQQYCKHHNHELELNSIHYARGVKHEQISLSLCKKYGISIPNWYNDQITFEDVIQELSSEISSSRAKNILISSEEFSRIGDSTRGTAAVKEIMNRLENYDCYAIYYVRDSVSFLSSFYRELCKFDAPLPRFLDFCRNLSDSFLDQSLTYRAWKEAFGPQNITTLKYPYSKEHVVDFLRLINSEYSIIRDENKEHIAAVVNESLSVDAVENDRREKISENMPYWGRQSLLNSQIANDAFGLLNFIQRVDQASENQKRDLPREAELDRYSIVELIDEERRLNGSPGNPECAAIYYSELGERLLGIDNKKALVAFVQSLIIDSDVPTVRQKVTELLAQRP